MKEGLSFQEFESHLRTLPPETLTDALVSIYAKLFCNEAGQFDEEGSLAAKSAADFVAHCNEVCGFLEVESG